VVEIEIRGNMIFGMGWDEAERRRCEGGVTSDSHGVRDESVMEK
jgi:hypothetical protein